MPIATGYWGYADTRPQRGLVESLLHEATSAQLRYGFAVAKVHLEVGWRVVATASHADDADLPIRFGGGTDAGYRAGDGQRSVLSRGAQC